MYTNFPINLLNEKFLHKSSEEVILGEQNEPNKEDKKTLDNLEPQSNNEDFSSNLINFLTQKRHSTLNEEKQLRAEKLGL
jgi:hypothetical protein